MCELFGFCCNGIGNAATSLQRFAEHSDRNPHGWGLAYYKHSEAILKKQAIKARLSPDYYDSIKAAESDIIISHIRHASCGKINEANCHPFKRYMHDKDWVFAHNGHVDGVARDPRSIGETDSESVFYLLMDHIRPQGVNDAVHDGLISGITSLFEEYEFGREIRLNFVLSDGDTLYAFNHHPEKPMYYTKGNGGREQSIVVSTQKLDGNGWAQLPTDRLLMVNKGKFFALSNKI